jgi:Copper binding proteins, plastocyanin/azurin family
MLRIRTLAAVAAVGFALAVAASAGAAPLPRLTGTVGPGFTITLKRGAKPVKTLKAGRYRITVVDRSNIHNFRLKGPGVDREITTVAFAGAKTVVVTLKKGRYTFVCDPHFTTMKGSFRVV